MPDLAGPHATPRGTRPPKWRAPDMRTQHLKVLHQRVCLDVDLATRRLAGVTELTVVPTASTLKAVRLDCREMKVTGVFVNGRRASYVHRDWLHLHAHDGPDSREDGDDGGDGGADSAAISVLDYYSNNLTVHQHHLVRQKLSYIFGEHNPDPREPPLDHTNGNTEELSVLLPDYLKLELVDAQSPAPRFGHASATTPRTKNTFSTDTYTPVVVRVEYEVINPHNGVVFAAGAARDRSAWHAYTTNSEFNVSTSSWVPCVDNMLERSTWSLELSIPRTVADVGAPRVIGTKAARGRSVSRAERQRRRADGEVAAAAAAAAEAAAAEELDDDADDSPKLVVCTGDVSNVKEAPHQIDLSKKVVMWSIFNPVCAHHVGWAVGCFTEVAIPLFRQDESDDEGGAAAGDDKEGDPTVTVFCLPHASPQALNSCVFMNRTIDFYSKEFGSFPFSSYAMVFVEESPVSHHDFAGLSVASSRLLYPPDLIEPMIDTTECLVECLAAQWSGINVVAQSFNDLWCTIGIARFMGFQFIRELMGANEYRFRVKRQMQQIVESDNGKNPLAVQFLRFPVSTNDLDFVKLKAPVVLYILDKRMTKTDKSFGLSRVLPKIFLQAMSGDLPNGTLSTSHFQHVCEKVNRNKLDSFFSQWVCGAGVPIFHVSQRFNKKRSLIEVTIRQVQQQETRQLHPTAANFLNDAVAFLEDEPSFMIRPVFSGPMTIRIHETDGIPYEHIVEIKESSIKLDIQHNSRFRRKKREEQLQQQQQHAADGTATLSTVGSADPTRLGRVLTTAKEVEEWGLVEWTRPEEDTLDAFEWVRVDADFEWIAKIVVMQPDHMYAAQLQQDRDVEAQYDAIRHFGDREKPTLVHCTILTRTIMDTRYYYGVRIAAAEALANFSTSANLFIGVKFLLKVFRKLFCFEGSSIPKSNDFSDFNAFFLQRAIPRILSRVRDDNGRVPVAIRKLLLNLVKYNDNSNNEFQDCFFLTELMHALTTSAVSSGNDAEASDAATSFDHKFVEDVITELNRLLKLDEWLPSYHSVVAVAALRHKVDLALKGLHQLSFEDLLYFTLAKNPADLRTEAFRGVLLMGGLKNAGVLTFFAKTLLLERNRYLKKRLMQVFAESICVAAIEGTPSTLDDAEFKTYDRMLDDSQPSQPASSAIVVEDGASSKLEINSRRDAYARATLQGSVQLLRRDYAVGKGLQKTLWELLHSSLLGVYERRLVFTLCEVLYQEYDSFIVHLSIPPLPLEELKRRFVVKNLGGGLLVIKREPRNKITLAKKDDSRHSAPVAATAPSVTAAASEPKIKLKISANDKKASTPIVAEAAPPKIAAAVSASPRKERRLVRADRGTVTFRLPGAQLSKVRDPQQAPVSPPLVTKSGTVVTLSLKGAALGRLRRASESTQPEPTPRYVKISLTRGKVDVSPTPFEE
ncbi:Transcription initiation factor TFIID subunit 2 [[Candida] zeylanoides]